MRTKETGEGVGRKSAEKQTGSEERIRLLPYQNKKTKHLIYVRQRQRQRGRERERDRDKETDRQTEKERDRDRETDRERERGRGRGQNGKLQRATARICTWKYPLQFVSVNFQAPVSYQSCRTST